MAGVADVYADGSFLAYPTGYLEQSDAPGFLWYRHELLRMSPDGTQSRPLGEFVIAQSYWDGRRQQMDGYGRASVRALDRTDLLFGDAGSFELLRYDSSGTLKQIVRRAYEPVRVGKKDKEELASFRIRGPAQGERASGPQAGLAERIASFQWAANKPAYSAMLVDSAGHIWVEEYRFFYTNDIGDDPGPTFWSVFDREGIWLGRVEAPGRFLVKRIYADILLGVWKDADGNSSIRAYRIIRPETRRP